MKALLLVPKQSPLSPTTEEEIVTMIDSGTNVTMSDEFPSIWAIGDVVRCLAQEVFYNLDADGGIETAQFIIERAKAGRISGSDYIDRACGCFYGTMTILENGLQDVDTLGGRFPYEDASSLPDWISASPTSINYILRDIAEKSSGAYLTVLKAGEKLFVQDESWTADITPMEVWLRDVEPNDNAQTNTNLAVLVALCEAYIAQKAA